MPGLLFGGNLFSVFAFYKEEVGDILPNQKWEFKKQKNSLYATILLAFSNTNISKMLHIKRYWILIHY